MSHLKILNSREMKKINKQIFEQFGTVFPQMTYLLSPKKRLYCVSKDIEQLSVLKFDSVGLYLGTFMNDFFRPGIEGSQILGKTATKGIATISDTTTWMKGGDVSFMGTGLYLVTDGNDFLGSGIAKEGILINHVPKERRINT